MNYRMSKTWAVLANVVWQDRILCNDFRVRVDWTTATDDSHEQNIAFERMKYWLFDVLEHSVLVSKDCDKMSLLQATGQRVIVLPGDPIDPMISIMLLSKFMAITESRMLFTEVAVSSEQGGHVQYLQSAEEDFMEFAQEGWWREAGPAWRDKTRRGTGKIVNLDRVPEWTELNLGWQPADDMVTDGSVVFAEFPKRAD